jgi:hypothetical protein
LRQVLGLPVGFTVQRGSHEEKPALPSGRAVASEASNFWRR